MMDLPERAAANFWLIKQLEKANIKKSAEYLLALAREIITVNPWKQVSPMNMEYLNHYSEDTSTTYAFSVFFCEGL